MSQSFSPEVATRLIRENPGRDSEQIVTDALDRRIITSRGLDRLAGQRGALAKMYNAGRLPEVRRDETRRPYRYYPRNDTDGRLEQIPPPVPSAVVSAISFRPKPEQDEMLEAVVSVGAFSNRNDAVLWTLEQGIEARRDFFQQALITYRQIEKLREGVKRPNT